MVIAKGDSVAPPLQDDDLNSLFVLGTGDQRPTEVVSYEPAILSLTFSSFAMP